MRRRRVLANVGLLVTAVTAGCHEDGDDGEPVPDCGSDWTPTVEATEPALSPGEETVAEIAARHVSGLVLRVPSLPPDYEHVAVEAGDAEVSPPPDRTADAYPPQWFWEACTHVDVTVPVRALPDAEPGEYTYGVHLVQSLGGDGGDVDREFAVTVVAP